MERALSWIRENPQFAAIIFFVAVLTFVMTVLAITMTRAGASLRPIVWFLGFVFIIGGPQAVVHLLDGFVIRRAARPAPPNGEPEPALPAVNALAPVAWSTVFGPKADPALITDAKRGLAQILNEAIEAKLSFNANGESALAARFVSAAAAARTLNAYGNFFVFADAQGSDAAGWTARRHGGQGEWVHVVAAGPELYAWTGASKENVLEHRVRALGPLAERSEPAPSTSAVRTTTELVSKRLSANIGLMALFVSLNVVAAVLWFFKGSAWAARVNASETVRPVAEQTLRSDLMALNTPTGPTDVALRPDGSMVVDWRYADARWFDLMRFHQMKRTQRLVFHFDEPARTVRVREYWSAFDASAGADGLRLKWSMATGIQFFAFEHTRVFGVQVEANGKPTGELSKAYTFNLQALKAPFIETITGAGWKWQPVAWNAPASLRWLTE